MTQNYLIYDCEIAKLIPPKDGTRLDGYEYCDGWNDHQGMGVAVVGFYCSWNSPSDALRWWAIGHQFPLNEWFPPARTTDLTTHVIGFNSKRFDDKLMAAHGVTIKTTYDLLNEILLAAGQLGKPYWKKGLSYSLGKIGEANGFPKTGTGELAPQLWQDGKFQEVITYCMNDVRITHELLKLGWAGELIDPNDGKKLLLRSLEEVPVT